MKAFKRCLILLVDGSRPDVFKELSDRGELPNCDRLFRDGGRFADAVSVFPSTTGPAYLPFLTGCYPGTCNVPGIRWFDKKAYGQGRPRFDRYRSYVGVESFLLNRDIQIDHPTLFQYFNHPVNIFSAVNRGATRKSNKTTHSRVWYWYYAHLTDRWSFVDEAATAKLLKALEEDTDFAYVVFPAVDEYSHFGHPRHELTLQAYRNVDVSLGKIADKLKSRGFLDETLIILVSDHGLSKTDQHFGAGAFLEQFGLKTFYYPKVLKWNFDAASMVSGNGMLHMYFRDTDTGGPGRGWTGRTPFEQLEAEKGSLLSALLEQEAVDLLAGQSQDGSVVVLSRKGRARIFEEKDKIRYVIQGSDPFGYGPLPEEMQERETLHRTADTGHPDALMQLRQIFRSARTGDWVVSAQNGWDLRKRFEHPEHRSSHGGLIREQMMIPFFANVPLPNETVRSCDVFPTVLKLTGREIPSGIDGISLV